MKETKALLKIWYKCNYSCNFCHAEFKKSLMTYPLKIFYLKILLLKKKWVKVILTTWWESTLEKHFFDIVKFIKKHNLDFWIVTNGSTIYIKSYLDKLELFWIKYIYLSIHWFQDIHNKIVWDKNSYNKVVSIISDLKNRKNIKLFLNYVVTKENIHSIDDTINDLIKIWYINLSIKFSMLQPEWIWKDYNLFVSPEISTKIINDSIFLYKDNKYINIHWDWFPLCFFRENLNKVADLHTENINYITEVYENKIYNTDYWNRYYISECYSCDLKSNCYGIYEWYKWYYNNLNDLIKI